MVAKGVIIATSVKEAHDLRILVFDRFWIDTSPKSIRQGGIRGKRSKPVLIVYGAVDWRALMNELRPVFQDQWPKVFRLKRDPFCYD